MWTSPHESTCGPTGPPTLVYLSTGRLVYLGLPLVYLGLPLVYLGLPLVYLSTSRQVDWSTLVYLGLPVYW